MQESMSLASSRWIPAFAGDDNLLYVIPADAGIHEPRFFALDSRLRGNDNVYHAKSCE
jgi:hypothetical protein